MAKKEAAAAISGENNPSALQSTQEIKVPLPCSLVDFFPYALLAWKYCHENLPLFFEEADRFTDKFIDEQVALINATKVLPNLDTLLNVASAARVLLLVSSQDLASMAKRLKSAIDYAFKDATLSEIERKEAGVTAFFEASRESWSSASSFITKANTYLTLKAAMLISAGGMKSTFPEVFKTTGETFNTNWNDYVEKEKAVTNGVKALREGLKAILLELDPMLVVGKQIFEFDATERKMFTTTYLLNEVRAKHQAGLKGFVTLAGTEKAVVGVRVEIERLSDKFALTDKEGRYEIKVAGGTYNVRFSGEGIVPLVIKDKTVTPGVTSRLNVTVELAPLTVNAPEPLVAASQVDHAVSQIVSEMKDNVRTNGELETV